MPRNRSLLPVLLALAVVAVLFAPMAGRAPGEGAAEAQTGAPEAGVATGPVPGVTYTAQGRDVLDGDEYHYVRNGRIQANIVTRTAGNNGRGTFQPGWLADAYLDDAEKLEILDWSELMLTPTMPAGGPWGRPEVHLPLPDVSVDGDAIVAAGSAVAAPDVDAELRYSAVPDAPVIRMDLELTNTGSEPYTGYFHYLLDPDSSTDTSILPGIAGTNPGFRTSGWTENFVYSGATGPSTNPAHGIAWTTTAPAGIRADGYIFGAFFDAAMPAGGSRTITWYHVVDRPSAGSDVTANVAAWAAELEALDSDDPDPVVEGRVADTGTAEGVPGVEVVARNIDAVTIATASTDEAGEYRMRLPAGTYTLTTRRLGYDPTSRSIQVDPGAEDQRLDFEVVPVQTSASTGKVIPGPITEGGPEDVVIENQLVAMTVADRFNDPQLDGVTRGKPIDLAVQGGVDELDWINLPWMSVEKPAGPDNWQQLGVRSTSVEITESGGDRAVVEAPGVSTLNADVAVDTTYTVLPDEAWVTASSVFRNTGAEDLTYWIGDALDIETAGQTSYVPGPGPVSNPYGNPVEYEPTQPWVGMTGTSEAAYGLLYTSPGDFTVIGTGSYVNTLRQVTIPAGGEYLMERRIIAADATDQPDRFQVLARLYEDYLAEQTGLSAEFDVAPTNLSVGESATATVTVRNAGEEDLTGIALRLDVPVGLSTGDAAERTVTVPAGGEVTETWSLRAEDGGRVELRLTVDGAGSTIERTQRVFVNGPGWYWGDNHSHSRYSDGSGTIADNFASARAYGLSWLTATDHNTIAQREALPAEQREDFVALYGEEITSRDGHSLGYNIDGLIDWTTPPQQRVDDANASNGGEGFFFVAHPYYPGLEWDDWTIQDYTGIEVWNGFYPPRHPVNAQAFAKWDELNREGRQLVGIANSDGHNPGKIGDPHIRAYLPELAEESIDEVLQSGYFYGSDGPDLRFTVDGAPMGGTIAVPAAGGGVPVELSAAAPDEITAVVLLRNGEPLETWDPEGTRLTTGLEVDVEPGDFLRVEVETAARRFAFTNPVFVEEATDSTAPVGTAELDPAQPDGDDGWYTSPVTVALTASDEDGGSGVASVEYAVDGGAPQPYTAPFAVTGDGPHTVTWTLSDAAGNRSTGAIEFRIDTTSPELTVAGVADGADYGDRAVLELDAVVTDATSGPGAVSATLDGAEIAPDARLELWRLDLGAHELVVTGADRAGNATSTTVAFTVTTSTADLAALVERWGEEGLITVDDAEAIGRYLERALRAETSGRGSDRQVVVQMEQAQRQAERRLTDDDEQEVLEAIRRDVAAVVADFGGPLRPPRGRR